ncbi:DUF4255 domain-containing protein [Cyclobacterium marinum]|uniref:Pvc16 N-terminal domain-containing protein n=1 Tax=Cyclobacterium marinum (strain ATCC 25205 / DSM 745 / LMG 13164 / NCIMB 1802) TaxID=880070 RepID=G0J5K7_CYCMS|nr:DUF4255 domain-containing protein [Cyclobacterium marinum]AEL28456.1 hypothetical protein Cycma_4771 [Cyclobacterium marinum DSM 745]
MIFEVFQILKEQINHYFEEEGLENSDVVIDNIAMAEGTSDAADAMRDKMVLTLVNLHEEGALKNFPNHQFNDGKVQYKNRVINLHLFLLFSANRNLYSNSLKDLSAVIKFFQGKKRFNQYNTVFNRELEAMEDVSDFDFTLELYTPTFEEMNFIWGTLGGKQLPSVLYQLNILSIERDLTHSEGPLIESVYSEVKKKN